MAQVPYAGAGGTVAPDTRTPDDYQHIEASPAQFGAEIGKGLQQAGQGALQASKFYGQVAADDGTNTYQDFETKLLHGDPNKTTIGPDGQPQPDVGYLGLKGADALRARPDIEKALDDRLKQIRDGMPTDEAKLQFDTFSRRMRNVASEKIGTHADTQTNVYAAGVNETSANLALNHIANHAIDPDPTERKHGFSDLINARVKAAQLRFGNDPTIVADTVARARQDGVKAWTEGIAGTGDYTGAMRVLEEKKTDAGVLYEPLATQFRERADRQVGENAGKQFLAQARSGTLPQNLSASISTVAQHYGLDPSGLARTVQIESGGNPNARTGSYYGLTQLSQGEWTKYKPRPDASIWNATDNLEAGAAKMRAEGDQFAKNFGRQPSPFDSYMIHQQGLAGYSTHLSNPNAPAWQNMLATGEGREKGEAWAKKAIWGNVPDQYKASFGNVDSVTSGNFIAMWAQKFGHGGGPQFVPTAGINVGSATGAPLFARDDQETQPTTAEPASFGLGARDGLQNASATFEAPSVAPLVRANAMAMLLEDPVLKDNPRALEAATRTVTEQMNREEIAEGENARVKQQAVEQAFGGHITTINDMLHSPNPKWGALADKINHDPALAYSGEKKQALIDRIRRLSGEEQLLVQQQAFGPGYVDIRHKILSDGARVSDFSDDDSITPAGLKDINDRVGLISKSLDGPAVAAIERRVNFYLQGAKQWISFEDLNAPIKIADPIGSRKYNFEFAPEFVRRVDELREEAQKDPRRRKELDEFLRPANVEAYAKSFRNQSQMALERIAANENPLGEKLPAQKQPTPTTPTGVDPAAWVPLVNRPPTKADGAPVPLANWAGALNFLRQNPSPEVKQAFNEKYGAAGYDADALLTALAGGNKEARTLPPGATQKPPEQSTPSPAPTYAQRTSSIRHEQSPTTQTFRRAEQSAAAEEQQRAAEQEALGEAQERQRGAEAMRQTVFRGPQTTGAEKEKQVAAKRTALADLDREEFFLEKSGLGGAVKAARLRSIGTRRDKLRQDIETATRP